MEAWMRRYLAERKPFADWQAKMHMRAKRLEIRTGVARAKVAYLMAQNEAAELRGRSRARLTRGKVR